jgi:putative cardiolipin synthase
MPLDHPKTPSTALTDTADTHLARESATWRDGQLQGNGFYSLSKGQDAFGARLVLMSGAEQSIDAQYFLMKPDNAGLVFTEKLMEAADRGVRVRLLLDDVFTTVDDGYFFNPVSRKGLYALNYLGHFSLANRRMHNKSFIVDNQAAIVGGRNIAAEYFQLETTGEFIDFDMFATGPIVKDISDSFDTYWNNELAVPIEAISGKPDQELLERDDKAVRQLMKKAGNSIYADAINSPLMRQFSADEIDPYMAKARVIVDDPSKLRAEISEEHQILATEIAEVLNQAKQEIIIFTPYFIPGKSGIEFVRRLRDKGVRIIVITNSLASNNHTAVHSAYARYRKDLLKAGVELWEARANASVITVESDDTTLTAPLTLHTKGILVDRRQVFVGSLNLDPRSIDINTEMGLLIESEPLVSEMTDRVMVHIPRIAYRLQLDDSGKINWHANIDGHEVVETKEPLTSGWKRFTAWLLKIAPEQQL